MQCRQHIPYSRCHNASVFGSCTSSRHCHCNAMHAVHLYGAVQSFSASSCSMSASVRLRTLMRAGRALPKSMSTACAGHRLTCRAGGRQAGTLDQAEQNTLCLVTSMQQLTDLLHERLAARAGGMDRWPSMLCSKRCKMQKRPADFEAGLLRRPSLLTHTLADTDVDCLV